MASYGLCFVLVVIIVQICVDSVQGQIIKSSLTFVIDYTMSMSEEISSVKEEVNIIFDKVLSSKASQIENFVIVTFNDPDAEVRTITKDPIAFKRALASIRVHSDYNYDCPEKSMTGIELGLTNSLPLSYLYVFTDASASDYEKVEQIKSLAQKKQSQVVFLLTGTCGSTSDDKYQAYHQVARASGGQVFNMMKSDVKDILKYIEESITGRGFSLVDQVYPPGTHKVKFNVDAHTAAVLISLTGLGSRIGEVTGPGGSKPPTEPIVTGKDQMAVRRLNNAKPGDYELEIEGRAEVHIIMIAKSDLNFQLGFSVDSPSSMKDTVTRPPQGGNAFLGIRLLGEGVELTTAKILDLNNNVIAELPLTLVDKKEQFYVTPAFNPPYSSFLVTVIGKDLNTGTPVVRTGPTPIARQNPSAEPAVNTAPEITIKGAPKIIVEYDAPLKLKCNVHGYPAPNIVWSEKDTGIQMLAKVDSVDVPYDYVSILDINKANKNVVYQCEASNAFGTIIKYVEVETERKIYFDVTEAPKDIRVEYTKEGSIVCKIDAYPPATIAWYKDGAEFSGNTNVDISSDKSILTIKNMQPELQGKYTCEAKNALDQKVFIANVAIFGVEVPVIDKSHGVDRVTETTNAKLSCKILKGIPKPDIRWSFKPAGMATFSVMTETTETVHLNNVRKDQTGTYKCSAKNALGSDSFTMELVVEFPPTIENDDKVKEIKDGDEVRIPCDVTGEPAPTVSWFFKGIKLTSSGKISVSSDNSIKFKATPSDIGDYTCEAENKLYTAKKNVFLDVLEVPVIDKSLKDIVVTEKTNAVLSCRILHGNPKPSIRWSFQAAGTYTFSVMTETTETVHLNNVRKDQTGTYKCSAYSAQGLDSFTMELVVEFPPVIENDDKVKKVKDGDEVRIPCDVTGEPAPTVSWFFKGTRLASSGKISVSSDNSIKFKATPSDIGDYTCEAINKLDTVKKTVSLDVLEEPVIDKTYKTIRVTEKTNAALSCRILRGNPKPSILWSFQPAGMATSSEMTETTETVHLNNVRKDQTGTYKCSVKNAQGTDSFTMELVVEYPPIIKVDKLRPVEHGAGVRIPCDVTGEPAPTVKWFFKGTSLASSAKILISSDHSIQFKATPSDIGDYTCEAKNKLDTVKHTVFLDVLEVPVIDKSLKDIRVTEKTNAVLTCKTLQGNPKPSIRWFFQAAGTYTFSAMTETTETVHLNNVRKDQTGTYKCSAHSAQGADSFTMELVVEFPPTIENDDKVKEIKDGDEVTIPCDVTGEPAPTVSWFFKGIKLASSGKISVSSDNSIKFKATPSDIGDYTCTAANKLDIAIKQVFLDVLETPVIDKSLKDIRVTEKTNAVLTCRILHGNPKPSILWSFQPVGMATSSEMTETTETVNLNNVRKDQTGTYICSAKNDQGTDSLTMELVVEFPPTIENDDKVKEIKDGDEVRIPCDVTGEPSPTVSWFFKGIRLASSGKISVSSDNSIKFKATPSDIGDYTCEAANKLDTAIKKVFLDVLEIPVIDKSLKDIRVLEKTNAVLSCRILHGNPKPSILWSFQPAGMATSSEMTETTETVHLNNVRKDQTGTYKCSAKNAQGTDSFTMELVVEFPPTIENDDKVKEIKDGDEVKIPCDVTGEPAPTVSWFFKGIRLASSAKISVSSDNSIKFKATPSDIGDYTCVAGNKLDTAIKNVFLDVLEIPVIDKSLKDIRVLEKKNAVLSCRILHGNPKPSILWSFQPAGMATSSEMTETTETVHLNNVRKDQTGAYKCSAKNAQGTDSFTMELVVEFPPVIENDDKVKQIKNGDEVRIPCDVTGEPAPTVKWFFKGTSLASSAKILISSDHSIQFKATPSDIGDYTCEAKNKLDTAKKSVFLDVLEVPMIDKSVKDIRVTEKTNAVLSCRILQGNPKPSILWSFKSATMGTSNVMTETTETVHLKNVRKDQTGAYKCSAKNAQASDSITIKLVVEYPPIIKKDDKVIQIKDGEEVRIPCDVTGEPAPTVSWFVKGIRLTSSAKISVATDYSIKFKATPSDIGDYTCEAENKLDTAKKNVFLDVLEVPVIEKSLKDIRVPEKTNAVLTCKILHGNPKPSILWSFQPAGMATSSEMTETTETVYLNNVRKDQTGTYKCSALNSQGSDDFAMELVVEFPPVIENDDKVKKVKDGDEVRIPCDVTGEPAPTVSWFFKGIRLASSAKISVSSDNSIKFKATPSDIGDYTCEAKNKLDTAKKTVSLDVLEEPVIDKTHKTIRVKEKTNAALSCRILRGNPKPSIRWSFQAAGTYTFSVMTETTETVHLNNVFKDQTGTYKCSAKSAQGSDSFTMELVVEYPPIIKKDDKVIQIKDGEEVRIPCDVTGEPAPTVSWFVKGIRLTSSAKISVSTDNSIKFKATPSDIGDYTCEAENKLDTAKKIVFLDVLEVPVIDKSLKDIRVPEKTNAALSCRILQGNPKPSIRWSFQAAGRYTSNVMTETTETVHLDNVHKDQTGAYKCTARNTQGSDSFTMELIVEYPPIIKKDVTTIQIKDGDDVKISCDVTGEPAPSVKWFFYDPRLGNTAKAHKSSDHSFRFKAELRDIGFYRCEATNKLGVAKKTTELQVYIPVTIETPMDENIETMVGTSQILNCRADGYPRPHIKWTFQSSDPKIPVKDITPTGGVASVALRNLQLDQQGSYTCEAENGIGGPASITYDVNVFAPPVIVNTYPSKNFEAMEGDMTLRIQCKTTGNPTPSIVWTKKGLNLAMGSEWYDMEADGTLIIKNIDRASEGSYVCHAENFFAHVTERYEVKVLGHLVPAVPTSTIFVKEGETVNINCDIPHHKTDQLRWYKDSLAIASGELTLYSVTRSDDGLYTCRVSNPYKSRSVTTKVVVGYKPEFTTKEKEIVEFVHGAASVFLSCEAYGQPIPTTATWKHNGNTLDSKKMSYPLAMVYGATGTYECKVSNALGSIRRTFKVTSRDCLLDIKKDFPQKQPIMLSPSFTWPEFPVNDGYMIIPHRDYFYMHCPSLFSNPTLPEYTMAYCERDNTIKINGKTFNFAHIQCNEEVKPQVLRSGNRCLPGKTENVEIGYKLKSKFVGVFEVCLDTENNVPLSTKHMLSPHHTDRSTEAAWSNSLLPQDFDTLYDCSRQMYDITSALGRGLSTRDSCCFGKRQLVNSHNWLPGIPTSSAYDYLNVIPHWSTCNSKNWEDVEKSVRSLVKSAGYDLLISTGTANPRRGGASTDITLHDGRGGKQLVAPYLWKVVQDITQSASLAIIQINIPELTAAEASKHVLCPDICGAGISWIEPSNWQNVEDGYTYCCSIIEFEKAFGYNGRFSPLMKYILF